MISTLHTKCKPTLFLLVTLLFIQCSATSAKRSFGEVVDDNVILVKLRTRMMKKKDVRASNIKVKVWKGVVSLSGEVDSQEQIDRAIEISEQQRGVSEVRAYMVLPKRRVEEVDLTADEGVMDEQRATNPKDDTDVKQDTLPDESSEDFKEFGY